MACSFWAFECNGLGTNPRNDDLVMILWPSLLHETPHQIVNQSFLEIGSEYKN